MSRKTIKIRKTLKDELDAFGDGMSINKLVRIIVDDAEPSEHQIIEDFESININLDDDTFNKMKRCKLSQSETHSDTIARLLKEYKSKHSRVADDVLNISLQNIRFKHY